MGKNRTNQIILVLTVVIAIGAIATVAQLFLTQNVLSGIEKAQFFLEDNEIEANVDNDPIIQEVIIQETPLNFEGSTQDQISQFLEMIGLTVTETVGIEANIELLDASQESELQSAFLRVEPLNPRMVLVTPDEPIEPERLFLDTDFATQVTDDGRNFHKFTGWDVIRAGNVGINVFTGTCSGIENHNGKCVNVEGARNVDDDVHNFSTFYGIVKDVDISDWTAEGELFLRFDYGCGLTQRAKIFVTVKGDSEQEFPLICQNFRNFEQDVSSLAGFSDVLRVKIGGSALNVDNFKLLDFSVNNVQLEGNSIAIRQAVETLEGLEALSIIGTGDGRILDLGFVTIMLDAITVSGNERIVLDGDLETRINENTITSHAVTANGRTDADGRITLSIAGADTFAFKLEEENFDEGFNTLKFLMNDVVVNVGDVPDVRTFEYHRPFVIYILDFNVNPNEILAFNQENRAISVKTNDSTFISCGLTAGENAIAEPTILPPQVRIVDNAFTIATTNPQAGMTQATDILTGQIIPNTEFCSTIPELPRDTQLTFVVDGEFLPVDSPASQANFFVKCTRQGCSSNIGFSSGVDG